jgi:hypothetical protein
VATDWFGDRLAKAVHSNDFDLFTKTSDNAASLFLAQSTRFKQILDLYFVP